MDVRPSEHECVATYNIFAMIFNDRFETVNPTQFRIGDIVEVQATIVTVPVRNNRFKMILQLWALALLDGTFTDVCCDPHRYTYMLTMLITTASCCDPEDNLRIPYHFTPFHKKEDRISRGRRQRHGRRQSIWSASRNSEHEHEWTMWWIGWNIYLHRFKYIITYSCGIRVRSHVYLQKIIIYLFQNYGDDHCKHWPCLN